MNSEYDDEISGSEDIRAFDFATRSIRRLGQSQEFMDALFNPELRDVPIHSDEDNVDGFRKLFGTRTSTTVEVRRVAPKVELQDPLGGFDDDGIEKLLKAESGSQARLPADQLFANRHFPAATGIVTDFLRRPEIRKRVNANNRESVREAEANLIVSVLKHLEQATEDARLGKL